MAQTNDPNITMTPSGNDGRRSRPLSGESEEQTVPGERRRDSEGTPLVVLGKSLNENVTNGMKFIGIIFCVCELFVCSVFYLLLGRVLAG